jgi:hypothetical protein
MLEEAFSFSHQCDMLVHPKNDMKTIFMLPLELLVRKNSKVKLLALIKIDRKCFINVPKIELVVVHTMALIIIIQSWHCPL